MSNNYQGIKATNITMYLYLGANMITLMKNRTMSHPLFIVYEENIFLIDFENTSYFYQEYELMRAAIMISDFQFDETDSYNIIIYLITFIKGYLKYGRLQCDFCDLVDFYDYMLLNDLYYLTGNEKEKDILFLQRRYAISKWLYLYGNLLKKFLKEEFVK